MFKNHSLNLNVECTCIMYYITTIKYAYCLNNIVRGTGNEIKREVKLI